MKKQSSRFIVSGLFIFLFCPVARGQITWSAPIPITEGSSPDLVIDRKTGRLHIVTKRFDNTYTMLDSTGRILIQESIPESNDSYPSWSAGPSIAVDRYGNPHVCFKKRRSGTWNYDIFYTTRQNNRWSAPLRIAENKNRAFHVRMAADETDYIHVIYGEVPEGQRTWGPVTYCKIRYGIKRHEQTDIAPAHFRDDGGLEIDVDDRDRVHVVLGCPGLWANTNEGLISYYRGLPETHQLNYVTRLQTASGQGRTSYPDIFTDKAGFLHVSYGSTGDAQADGEPVVRYVRYHENRITRNQIISRPGDLDPYTGGAFWGVSTIAATDDGQGIVIAYLSNPNGTGGLRASMSADSGKTWYAPVHLAESSGGDDARNRPVIRAFRDHFYLVYPDNGDGRVKMRFLWNGGDGIPVAVLDSAYTGLEGHPITFDASRSYDVGQSPGIIEYIWDFNNNGIADAVTTNPMITHTYPDDFTGTLSLIVRDKWNQADTAYVAVEIHNVPPTVDLGPDRHLEEGDTLVLHAVVTDPGIYDVHTVYFRVDDGIWRYENPLIHVFEDDGNHTIMAWVTDKDGGVGYDTVRVFVANVPPTAVALLPKAGSTGMELRFEATATDPGIHDMPTLVYEWDLDDDGIFERRGRIITTNFTFEGFYPIHLRVTDKDGGEGFDSQVLQILDAPPKIAEIPDQIFPEGSVLPPVHLDEYVTDPVVDPDRLVWSVSGNTDLLVTLNNRILQVAVPDSQWHGEETLRLVCTNHIALSDTGEINYIILYVNDPPRWISPLTDLTLLEDDSLVIPYSDLLPRVFDPDHDRSTLTFHVGENPYITGHVRPRRRTITLVPLRDWWGETELVFYVTDPEGAFSADTVRVTVIDQPDEPYPFRLIDPMYHHVEARPDTIFFHWHASFDPDTDYPVSYQWTLEHQGGLPDSPVIQLLTLDTLYAFAVVPDLVEGTYFWWVTAIAQSGRSQRSDNVGFVVVGTTDVSAEKAERLPTEFALFQNYPNPFNPYTRIDYHLASDVPVRLAIYNPLGQCVRILEQDRRNRGAFTVLWDGRDGSGLPVQSGIYVCRMQAGDRVFEKKMLLLR